MERWPVGESKTYFSTARKDAIRFFESPDRTTKSDALALAAEALKESK